MQIASSHLDASRKRSNWHGMSVQPWASASLKTLPVFVSEYFARQPPLTTGFASSLEVFRRLGLGFRNHRRLVLGLPCRPRRVSPSIRQLEARLSTAGQAAARSRKVGAYLPRLSRLTHG